LAGTVGALATTSVTLLEPVKSAQMVHALHLTANEQLHALAPETAAMAL